MIGLDWKALWCEAQQGSVMEHKRPDGEQWLSFWDSEAAAYLEKVKKDEIFYRGIADYLTRERALRKGDRVLDIACGPGTYTLQFARLAGSVTALDSSAGMLSTLMVEAEHRKLRNIRPLKAAWDEYGEPGRYDLVFTALSPAIRGPEEFLRLEAFSSRSCCYVTFGEEEQSRTRDHLWKIIGEGAKAKKSFDVSYPFNLLMSLGRKPNVRFFDYESDERQTVEQLTEYHARFFGNFTEMDAEKKAKIADYLQSISSGGYCENWQRKSLVALYWDVPEAAGRTT